jgi:hypothetical protein
MVDKPKSGGESDKLIDVTWQHYTYRHELFWKSLYRWGSAVIAISIVPYVKPEILSSLGKAIFIFPVLAFLLGWIAAWHLGAEYWRFKCVDDKLREVLGEGFPRFSQPNPRKIFAISIGRTAVFLFALGTTFLSILNSIILGFLWISPHSRCT